MICVISVAHLGRKLSALPTLMLPLSSLLNNKLQSAVFDDICSALNSVTRSAEEHKHKSV